MILLGLDIGSNSVGSAWVDTDAHEVLLGVSVFPAGVEETEDKRGAPKNQKRRNARSQRRTLHRRAARKRNLRKFLTSVGLLPSDQEEFQKLCRANRWPLPDNPNQYKDLLKQNYTPWHLRRDALTRELHPYEFGRLLVHLNQRRGALGVTTDPEDPDEGKVKEGIDRLDKLMRERGSKTVGQLMADLMDKRRKPVRDKDVTYQEPIRNRQYRMEESQQLYADRGKIREEFSMLWDRQKTFEGELARLLTDDLKRGLDEPQEDDIWRHRGRLFGQRRTYWDTGTLGRCDLEPTERCVPLADMYAQEFRVIETVNNIRISERGKPERALTADERKEVIASLRRQKTASVATIRKALGIDKKAVKGFFSLNIERDPDREINTDWFYREIVHGAISEERWEQMSERERDSLNRAILKFDPDQDPHIKKLRAGAVHWWGLSTEAVDHLVEAWKNRPKLEKRLKLSRRAIRNLLPYMKQFDTTKDRWPTQIEARQSFASDPNSAATPEQRSRYALGTQSVTKSDRRYLRKHREPLPPAPMLSNPVVRKAIHEVRRHIIAWWRRFGRIPDRIVLEYVRSATQPEKVRNEALALNRKREVVRKKIIEQFELDGASRNQQARAVERVLLCKQQRGVCPYTGSTITEPMAVEGRIVEIDHIVPRSRSQNNGLNNKILVMREANRDKGNRTVKEWMSAEQFRALEQHLAHLEKGESPDEYFTKKDRGRKWENLHSDAPSTGEFLASQFTDTAYAAKQVGQWLREALYDGERDGVRRVFTTKGIYTSTLRNDWGLSESDLDRQWHGIVEPGEIEADNQSRRPRKEKNKDRADHIHHAVDAVCIVFAPDRLQDLARFAEEQEIARAQLGYWPRREALSPPWGTTEEFRRQVLAAADQLVVSHRPVKRRITGALHKDTLYGPIVGAKGDRVPDRMTIRQPIYENNQSYLKPAHLRLPSLETREEAIERVVKSLLAQGIKRRDAKRQAALIIDTPQFKRQLVDPSPGKTGIVRDLALRNALRDALRKRELDPDSFTGKELKDSLDRHGPLRHASGVPIKSAVLLWANNDPVVLPRYEWDPNTGQRQPDPDLRTLRLYDSQNNHHIEIRENPKTREWSGDVVPTFQVARQNAARLKALREAGVCDMPKEERNKYKPIIADINRRYPMVNCSNNDNGQFVMSLAEGETVCMLHPVSKKPGYFVVFKLDRPSRIHFIHHWDARPSKSRKDSNGSEVPNSKREDISVAPSNLMRLGVEHGQPPYKVRVGPLGEVTRLHHD